jgi:catechol 2,3-dioxygenase-like lactoylglutathione lyase family enzyme
MRPAVSGIVESALYVADLQRSISFYKDVLGFPEIMREEGRLHALGVAEEHVLLRFAISRSTRPAETPGGRIPATTVAVSSTCIQYRRFRCTSVARSPLDLGRQHRKRGRLPPRGP